MALSMSSAGLKVITEGKIAGKMAFDIIDRVPQINVNEGRKLLREQVQGRIELRNVTFRYPSK
jgi:ABC-type bacteriocin/lantibiotic exporter with double-glycine peptidase domain